MTAVEAATAIERGSLTCEALARACHTLGGSSSGSAAAVADDMVPLGLGTQTAGSLTRPAAYCGIVGFKPTFGRMNLTGRRRTPLRSRRCSVRLKRCAITPTFVDIDAARYTPGLVEVQKTVMAFEAAQSLAHEYRCHRDALRAPLRELIERGIAISYGDYVAAQQRAAAARAALQTLFDAHDVLLTPSAPGEAPRGLESTGDPVFSRAWTLLGVPSVTIPSHTGPGGLPIGIQLIGAADGDRRLLATADWLFERVRNAVQE